MEFFIICLQLAQYCYGLLHIGRFHDDFLESPVQSPVFFHDSGELVHRGGADALQLAPGKRRFQHVRGIQAALSATSPDDRVELIYEHHQIRIVACRLDYRLDPFLEIAPVFGACHH